MVKLGPTFTVTVQDGNPVLPQRHIGKPPPDDAFRQQERFEAGLRELGWTPGSNIVVDYRYADGHLDHLPGLAAELVRIPVHVIVARGLTIRAAREATATIPIVMAADPDPVRSGFVVSLARPGGSITGLSTLAPDLEAKQLELLREALPSLTRVGVLANANFPSTEETAPLEVATRSLRLALTESRINRSEQLAPAFATMKQAGIGAVLFRYDLWFIDPTSRRAGSPTPSAHDAQFAAIRGGGRWCRTASTSPTSIAGWRPTWISSLRERTPLIFPSSSRPSSSW
jgi:hypothetical protein